MNNSYVKTFEMLLGKYVYDANRDEIIQISDALYDYLNGKTEKIPPDGLQLMEQGYLSEDGPEQIEHQMLNDCEYFLERKASKITLQLTQGCNFRCAYCVYSEDINELQRSHSSNRMSYETAIKAVDFLAEHSIDSPSVNIGFYGGEPLLEFEMLKKIVSYTNKKFMGKEVTYSITTNGTLLNESIIEFFIENHVILMVSLDGSKKAHDRNRVLAQNGEGSYDIVISKLNMISDKYPDYFKKIQISMVIDPRYPYTEYSDLFDNNNIKDVGVRSTVVDDSYSVKQTVFSNEYLSENKYRIFLALLSELDVISKKDVCPIALQELSSINRSKESMGKRMQMPVKMSHGGPCVPGQNRLFVNVNGDFYPCERVSESSKIMHIGNVDEGFDFASIKNILNICSLTREECKNCWNISHCGICAKYADDGKGLQKELILSHCKNMKANTLKTFKYLAMMNDIRENFEIGGDYE